MSLTSPGLSVFFRVSIDAEFDLGFWNSVSGLHMGLKTDKREDTAITFLQHHKPQHVVYNNITVKRPCINNSSAILNWISAYHLLPIPTMGEISAVGQDGVSIASWQLLGVSPVEWKGPDFNASGNLTVPEEALTIAHMGFL